MNLVRQEPEWVSGKRNSVTVVKTSNLSVVLTAIKKGATLCGHEVDGPVTVQVLSGAIQFGVLGESRSLAAGTVIALDKGIPHDIQALQDSELLTDDCERGQMGERREWVRLAAPRAGEAGSRDSSSTSTSCSVLLLTGRVYTALLSRVEP